jgi:hypothetical protein
MPHIADLSPNVSAVTNDNDFTLCDVQCTQDCLIVLMGEPCEGKKNNTPGGGNLH